LLLPASSYILLTELDTLSPGKKRMSYYASRKSKLLKDFDTTASLMRDYLVQRYGQEFANTLNREVRQEYEGLIPGVPYIKGVRAKALNSFLLITAQEVAVYKAMKKHGKGPSEAWEICHEAVKRRMARFSNIKRWFLKHLMYSRFLMRRVKRRAERQEQLRFGDFEIRYVMGDGTEFDWGADREALNPIDQAIVATQGDAAARKALEKRLVDALASGISRSAQDYVCRKLRVVGTDPVRRGPRRSSAGRGDLAHRTLRPGTHSGREGGRGDAGRIAEGQQQAQTGHYRFAGRTSRQEEHHGHLEASRPLRHPSRQGRRPVAGSDRHVGCGQGTEPVREESI